jgi:hypothetical protein
MSTSLTNEGHKETRSHPLAALDSSYKDQAAVKSSSPIESLQERLRTSFSEHFARRVFEHARRLSTFCLGYFHSDVVPVLLCIHLGRIAWFCDCASGANVHDSLDRSATPLSVSRRCEAQQHTHPSSSALFMIPIVPLTAGTIRSEACSSA